MKALSIVVGLIAIVASAFLKPMLAIILFTLAVVAIAAYIIWRYYLSIVVVEANEFGVKLHWGVPVPNPNKQDEPEIYHAGKVFVPWIPIPFDGHRPWEFRKATKDWFWVDLEGEDDDGVVDKDGVAVFPQMDLGQRFPWADAPAIGHMVSSGVPFDGLPDNGASVKKYRTFVRREVMATARDIAAGMPHKELRSAGKLTEVNQKANDDQHLRKQDGLFVSSGLLGTVVSDNDPGKGQVILRFRLIALPEEVQAQINAVSSTAYGVQVAENEAMAEAARVSGLDKAMDGWIRGQIPGYGTMPADQQATEFAKLKTRLMKSGAYAREQEVKRQVFLAQGGSYKEARSRQDITGLPDGVRYVSFGGGGPAVMMDDRGGESESREQARERMRKENDQLAAERRKKK